MNKNGDRWIIFTEPYTLSDREKKQVGSKEFHFLVGRKIFKVNSQFYKVLTRKPKISKCRGMGNAYIFGKRYPLGEYKKIGSHGNDGAQTGFVDLEKWLNNQTKSDHDIWSKSYKPKWDWDDRVALKKVQQVYPEMIFVGQTVGGDVGADLYAHYDRKKEIDSLIIENYCLFPCGE